MSNNLGSRSSENEYAIDGIVIPDTLKEGYSLENMQNVIEILRESVSNLQELTREHIMLASEAANIAHALYDRTEIIGWHLLHKDKEFKKNDERKYGKMIDSVTDIHTNLCKLMIAKVIYSPSELAEKTREEYFQLHPDQYKEDAA
jgi:hypothetical protein